MSIPTPPRPQWLEDVMRGKQQRLVIISTGGGAMCVLYSTLLYSTPTLLGKASQTWEVRRKSIGSLQEVRRNFFLNRYLTRSMPKIVSQERSVLRICLAEQISCFRSSG